MSGLLETKGLDLRRQLVEDELCDRKILFELSIRQYNSMGEGGHLHTSTIMFENKAPQSYPLSKFIEGYLVNEAQDILKRYDFRVIDSEELVEFFVSRLAFTDTGLDLSMPVFQAKNYYLCMSYLVEKKHSPKFEKRVEDRSFCLRNKNGKYNYNTTDFNLGLFYAHKLKIPEVLPEIIALRMLRDGRKPEELVSIIREGLGRDGEHKNSNNDLVVGEWQNAEVIFSRNL